MVIAGIVCVMFTLPFATSDKTQASPKVINLKMANFYHPPAQQSKISEEFATELKNALEVGSEKTLRHWGTALTLVPQSFISYVS